MMYMPTLPRLSQMLVNLLARQAAKEHTFAPLFGATGYGRTPAEAAYYTKFMDKYKGIAAWHKRLADEVLATGCITTPSGRAFASLMLPVTNMEV